MKTTLKYQIKNKSPPSTIIYIIINFNNINKKRKMTTSSIKKYVNNMLKILFIHILKRIHVNLKLNLKIKF